jgi:putative glutathione S-transferase
MVSWKKARQMGVLIDGKWTNGELPQETGQTGQFNRADSAFRGRITADGSGFKAEPGRYHLYVAHGCPWAHRTLIYRALKKLEGAVSVAPVNFGQPHNRERLAA